MRNGSDLPDTGHLTYLDFELEIGLGSGREYPIAVVRSPAGEARETLRFPFDELALESRLKDLQIALLRSGGKRRQMLSQEERVVQDFGRALFDSLVVGEVRSRYDVSQREATGQGKGLRLKLRIQPPELAALPWEYLYDSRQAEYVCLSRNTPVVRYLELPQPILPLTVTPPLRILGMVASPNDLPPLDVAREKQRVENAIQALRANGLVELTWLEGQTWRDLQRAMRMGPWHVFHFIGHGGYDRQTEEGCIALADEEGQASRLSATQLGRLLADHRSLRMVLLNACEGARGSEHDIFSSAAAILVRRGIPAVLAMQYEITDRAAIEFARTFYEALTDEMPVDEAVTEARKAISMMVANTVEWGTPVLYSRSSDGALFRIQGQAGRVNSRKLNRIWIAGGAIVALIAIIILGMVALDMRGAWIGESKPTPILAPASSEVPLIGATASSVLPQVTMMIVTVTSPIPPTIPISPTPVPKPTATNLPTSPGVMVGITFPLNGSTVVERVIVRGMILGLGSGQHAFLCIKSQAFSRRIYPQGEIVPDSSGKWAVDSVYGSSGYGYETFVVVTGDPEAAKTLADGYYRTNGMGDLPLDAYIVGPTIVVTRQ